MEGRFDVGGAFEMGRSRFTVAGLQRQPTKDGAPELGHRHRDNKETKGKLKE